MPFDKFIETFDPTVEDFDPAAFKEKALAEYRADQVAIQEAANAKITGLSTELNTALEKVTKVQAHNYDLLQQVGSSSDRQAPGAAGDAPPKPKGDPIKSLFKKES
jgi:hypothetical protein